MDMTIGYLIFDLGNKYGYGYGYGGPAGYRGVPEGGAQGAARQLGLVLGPVPLGRNGGLKGRGSNLREDTSEDKLPKGSEEEDAPVKAEHVDKLHPGVVLVLRVLHELTLQVRAGLGAGGVLLATVSRQEVRQGGEAELARLQHEAGGVGPGAGARLLGLWLLLLGLCSWDCAVALQGDPGGRSARQSRGHRHHQGQS
jgi:hypothetical protein